MKMIEASLGELQPRTWGDRQLTVRGPYPNIARNETFTSIIIHNFGRTCTYHCTGNWNCNLLCSCRGSSNFIMPAFLLVFPLALDTDAWVTVIWSQESSAEFPFILNITWTLNNTVFLASDIEWDWTWCAKVRRLQGLDNDSQEWDHRNEDAEIPKEPTGLGNIKLECLWIDMDITTSNTSITYNLQTISSAALMIDV